VPKGPMPFGKIPKREKKDYPPMLMGPIRTKKETTIRRPRSVKSRRPEQTRDGGGETVENRPVRRFSKKFIEEGPAS